MREKEYKSIQMNKSVNQEEATQRIRKKLAKSRKTHQKLIKRKLVVNKPLQINWKKLDRKTVHSYKTLTKS